MRFLVAALCIHAAWAVPTRLQEIFQKANSLTEVPAQGYVPWNTAALAAGYRYPPGHPVFLLQLAMDQYGLPPPVPGRADGWLLSYEQAQRSGVNNRGFGVAQQLAQVNLAAHARAAELFNKPTGVLLTSDNNDATVAHLGGPTFAAVNNQQHFNRVIVQPTAPDALTYGDFNDEGAPKELIAREPSLEKLEE